MGAWGEESCSNDDCWDYLDMEDIHNPDQSDVVHCLDEALTARYGSPHLGCVIWFLRHGLKVSVQHLAQGIVKAEELLADEDYLSRWCRPDIRAQNLEKEIREMKQAIIDGGQGKVEHIPGLFEKISGETK
jgi:hypothetical protein